MKNIAEIIENKNTPIGLSLYSPIIGIVIFQKIDDSGLIITKDSGGVTHQFTSDGCYIHPLTNKKSLEVMLFPGTVNRNWDYYETDQESFDFSKGDVVRDKEDNKLYEITEVHTSKYVLEDVSTGIVSEICISDQKMFKKLPKPIFNKGDQIIRRKEYLARNVVGVSPLKIKSVESGYYVLNGADIEEDDDWKLYFEEQHQYRMYCPKPLFSVGDKVRDNRDMKIKYISWRGCGQYNLMPKSENQKYNTLPIEEQSKLLLLSKAFPFKVGDIICPVDCKKAEKLLVIDPIDRDTKWFRCISFITNNEEIISIEDVENYELYRS